MKTYICQVEFIGVIVLTDHIHDARFILHISRKVLNVLNYFNTNTKDFNN